MTYYFSYDYSDKTRVAYQAIKRVVLSGKLRPGEPLKVGIVADRLKISQTPVREALLLLYAEKHIELRRKHGFAIKTLSVTDMAELYKTAFVLLEHCARRLKRIRPARAVVEDQAAAIA